MVEEYTEAVRLYEEAIKASAGYDNQQEMLDLEYKRLMLIWDNMSWHDRQLVSFRGRHVLNMKTLDYNPLEGMGLPGVDRCQQQ